MLYLKIAVLFSCGCYFAAFAEQMEQTGGNSNKTVPTYSTEQFPKHLSCEFAPGFIVGNRTRELECCEQTARSYQFRWYSTSLSLTKLLETLQQWNCPQFLEQCETRVFAFTQFTSLVYDYYCNYTSVVEKCFSKVTKTVSVAQKRSNLTRIIDNTPSLNFKNQSMTDRNPKNSSLISQWKNIISRIQPSLLSLDELKEPCIEIAQYDVEEVHDGGYQELINLFVPTCELTWCGFSAEAFQDHRISFWSCLSSK